MDRFQLYNLQKGSMPPPDRIGHYIQRMEKEGVTRVKMFFVITVAYLIFWGPLFLVTLLNWDWDWVDAKKSWAHDVCFIENMADTLHSRSIHGPYPDTYTFTHDMKRTKMY